MLSNEQAVQAYHNHLSIEKEVATATEALKALRARLHELTHTLEAAEATSEVFEGVAMRVEDGHVWATSYEVDRHAYAFEHATKPGTFFVRAETRGHGDRIIDNTFHTMEDAVLAAKSFVAGV